MNLNHQARLLNLYRACGTFGLAAALIAVSMARAETLESVEKALIQKQNGLKSYSAKTESKHDMDLGQGNRSRSESKGTMEWLRRGDKVLYRLEMKSDDATVAAGTETKTKSVATIVCDGEFIYTLSEVDGEKSAVKMRAMPEQSYDAKATFDTMRRDHDLKLLPDEKVEGQDCYLIEAVPKKKEANAPILSQRLWFRKDLGIAVKVVGLGKDGKPAMTSTTTEIKTNVDLKPERFRLEIPKGVKLLDLTKEQPQTAVQTAPADEKGEESSSAPPKESAPKKKDNALKGLLKKALK